MKPVFLNPSLVIFPVRRWKSVPFSMAIARKRMETTSGATEESRERTQSEWTMLPSDLAARGSSSNQSHGSRASVRFRTTDNP